MDCFLQAAELAGAEREAFLSSIREREPQLRRKVDCLLEALERTERVAPGATPSGVGQNPPGERVELAPGAVVGTYRLSRKLGRGGMGTVFLVEALEEDGGPPRALKVMSGGFKTRDLVRRFHLERRVLASLDHPYIAQLIDAGATNDGRPFLVMDFVEGEPIDTYCQRLSLPLKARLELFLEVCRVVSYAHSKLVIHRDLKPSNILVTPSGEPRLLDFGMAKLLSAGAEDLEATGSQFRAMTPSYASPEQVLGDPVTVQSDVYGLGLLLYELLTGQRAQRVKARAYADIHRVIVEQEPRAPHRAVEAQLRGKGSAEAAGIQSTLSEKLARQMHRRLQGDLGTIVLKALRKQPGERYSSVERLIQDLRSYLAGQPILARPATLSYRLAKFLGRYRLATTVLSLVFVMGLGFAVASAVQARRLASERDSSEIARQQATELASFLGDLFEGSPIDAGSDRLTVKALLDRGAQRLASEPRDAQGRAGLLEALGRAYRRQGYFQEARPILEEALSLRRQKTHELHVETTRALQELAWIHLEEGDYQRSIKLLKQALEIRQRDLGPDHLDVAEILLDLAQTQGRADRFELARQPALQALAIYREQLEPGDVRFLPALYEVGELSFQLGEYELAEESLAEAIPILEQSGKVISPEGGSLFTLQGRVLLDRGQHREAIEAFRRALDAYTSTYGSDHPSCNSVHGGLGRAYSRIAEYDKAEEEYRRSYEMTRAIHGPSHDLTATSLHNLGKVTYLKGDLSGAEDLLRQALEIYESSLGDDHLWTSFPRHYLGAIARRRGDLDRAEKLLSQSLDQKQDGYGTVHLQVAHGLAELARLRRDQGQTRLAEDAFREALTMLEESAGEDHPMAVEMLSDLATLLEASGRGEEALPLLRQAAVIRRNSLGSDHPLTLEAVDRIRALEAAVGG